MLAQAFRRTLLATLILTTSLLAFAMDEGDWWNCNSLMHPLIRVEGVRMPKQFMPLIETPRLLIGRTIPSEGSPDQPDFQPLNPQNPASLEVLSKDGFRVIGTIYIIPTTKGDLDGARLPLGFNKDIRTRGIGTEAKFAALKYAFEVLHVQFVHATILDDNYASLALHEKLGFVDDDPDHPQHTRQLTLTARRFAELKDSLVEYESPMHFFKPRAKMISVYVKVWNSPEELPNYFRELTERLHQELGQVDLSPARRKAREALYRELQPRGVLSTLVRRQRSPEAVLSAMRTLNRRTGWVEEGIELNHLLVPIIEKIEDEMTHYETHQVPAPKADDEP